MAGREMSGAPQLRLWVRVFGRILRQSLRSKRKDFIERPRRFFESAYRLGMTTAAVKQGRTSDGS